MGRKRLPLLFTGLADEYMIMGSLILIGFLSTILTPDLRPMYVRVIIFMFFAGIAWVANATYWNLVHIRDESDKRSIVEALLRYLVALMFFVPAFFLFLITVAHQSTSPMVQSLAPVSHPIPKTLLGPAHVDTGSDATWALVRATVGLCLITLGAVIVGGLAALKANETYRLEAEPVLVVTETTQTNLSDALRYVIDANQSLDKGIILRTRQANDDYVPTGQHGETITLSIQNAGRSPALDVTLPMCLSRLASLKAGETCEGFVEDEAPNEPYRKQGHQYGHGEISIPAIPRESVAFVSIESLLGVGVTITPGEKGTQVRWTSRKRTTRSIAAITPSTAFVVRGATEMPPGSSHGH